MRFGASPGGFGGVVAFCDLAAQPGYLHDFETGQDQVGVGVEQVIDGVEPVDALPCVDAFVPDYFPDELPVFLLDVGVIVFLVGATAVVVDELAIEFDGVALGAPSSDGPGSAYTFQLSGEAWIQTSKLVADGGSGFEQFGWSVAISGEYAIVGALVVGFDVASGAAYVFQRDDTGWRQAKRLVADGIAGMDYSGVA